MVRIVHQKEEKEKYMTRQVDSYIPFGGESNIGPGAELLLPKFPTLSWCVGARAEKLVLDEVSGEEIWVEGYYKGFFFDYGVDAHLDSVAAAAGLERRRIEHQDSTNEHWILPKDVFYIILRGWQSKGTMAKTVERKGLAYGYRYQRDKKFQVIWDRPKRTYIYLQVFPRSLLAFGKPFVITVNSTQTDDLLNVLRTQYKVLKYAREYFESIHLEMEIPFYAYGIEIATSKNRVTRQGKSGSKDIFVMTSVIPDPVTTTYLKAMEMPLAYREILERYAEQSVAWSTEIVQDIVARDAMANSQHKGGEASGHPLTPTQVPVSPMATIARPWPAAPLTPSTSVPHEKSNQTPKNGPDLVLVPSPTPKSMPVQTPQLVTPPPTMLKLFERGINAGLWDKADASIFYDFVSIVLDREVTQDSARGLTPDERNRLAQAIEQEIKTDSKKVA